MNATSNRYHFMYTYVRNSHTYSIHIHFEEFLFVVSIESIREVRKGRGTQFLQSAATDIPETLCMTIIHGTKYAQLNLAMKTQQDRDAWATALTSLVKISRKILCVLPRDISVQLCMY